MKASIKAALITGIFGIVGTVTAAFIGSNVGEKNAIQQLYNQVTTVNGNNNIVTVNSVDEFITQYNKLLNENETLKAQNSQYFADYTEQKNINNNLQSQLDERPAVSYNSVGLCVDTDNILLNTNNSMVTIDGIDYFSKEIVESLIPYDKNITIKNDTMFVGRVVADKTNLFSFDPMDYSNISLIDSITDSYGNNYSHVLYTRTSYTGSKYIIYPLNRKFSLMKMTVAIRDDADINSTGILTIKADDDVVYTSDSLYKKMEPFTEIDIPINNCNLLTIEYAPSSFNIDCIISNAEVYN